jgi:hypothetical protein
MFPRVAKDLQEAQARGRGAISRVQLATVKNDYWDIEEGFICHVTFVYLNRVPQWEVSQYLSVWEEISNVVSVRRLSCRTTYGRFVSQMIMPEISARQ